ncbi:MAG: FtsW/RodA/SpoVE family cell cycle protein, partial [Patescibacteria group bacterium]
MRQSSPGKPDFVLLSLASVLVVFGLIVLSSASSVVAFDKWGNSFYLVKHQIFFGLIPGLIFFIVALRTPYIFWRKIALPFLGVTVALLILILIPGFGSSLGGSRSWLILGGVSFQPSELAKIVMIFYLAAWFERKDKMVKDFGYGFVPFLCILGMIVLLLVLQPDVGTMTIVVAIAMIMYFVAGAAWRHVVAIGGLGLALLGILIKFAPYRAARLMTFVRPELDPQGVGYHINQALLAVGSGGFFGLGFGQSRQKFRYLPEVSGDSIFAVMA